jgi:hypothetical protein
VSSLIGERLQIRATAKVVERQPRAGACAGQRGEAEGSSARVEAGAAAESTARTRSSSVGVLQNRRGASRTRECCSAGPVSANELEHM